MSERPVPGTEGPAGHEAGAPVDDRQVPWRVFVFIGAFVALMGAIYWAASYESAGVVMLLTTAALGLWIAAYLWLQQRGGAGPVIEAKQAVGEYAAAEGRAPAGRGSAPGPQAPYLPHASSWPFAIGLGAATFANGLVLGLWVIVPGVALIALGVAGFVRQTRRRD